jgi:hypothetical protein
MPPEDPITSALNFGSLILRLISLSSRGLI